MRTRNRLHVDKLDAFKTFCIESGWINKTPIGDWEVLRMRHPDRLKPLMVHKRLTNSNNGPLVHYTTHDEATTMLFQFLKADRRDQ